MKRSAGNGDPKVLIHFRERRPGHVLATPDNPDSLTEDYPLHLSRALGQWLDANPAVRVRHVLPIVNDGRTVMLHIWFDGELTPQS